MIQEFRKLLSLILISTLFICCQNPGNRTSEETQKQLSFLTSDKGEFIVNYSDTSSQVLLDDGISYEYRLSPNGILLAVDYTRFSNLQLSKLFSRKGSGRFSEILNLSGEA